jgi:CO/xanthine dehydrogenase FAD-binding subunit
LPPALLALNASVELRSRNGTRKVPLTEFFQGYFETAVEADEILSRVDIPTLPQGACGAYIKHSISPEDLAIAGVRRRACAGRQKILSRRANCASV